MKEISMTVTTHETDEGVLDEFSEELISAVMDAIHFNQHYGSGLVISTWYECDEDAEGLDEPCPPCGGS